MAGYGSAIDAYTSATAFVPQHTFSLQNLSAAGQQMYIAASTQFADVVRSVSGLMELRNEMLMSGTYRDDTSLYYINTFEALAGAGLYMQHYVMAHPVIKEVYNNGYDVYPEYKMPDDNTVYYGRVMNGVMQVTPNEVEFYDIYYDNYDDIQDLSRIDRDNLYYTYAFIDTLKLTLKQRLIDAMQEE
jgi:hypothetical protein